MWAQVSAALALLGVSTRFLCKELNEYVLLPAKSDMLKIRKVQRRYAGL